MRASPYNYSKDAKLRIRRIVKYWKPPNSPLRKQLVGRDPNNKFDGFKVINYQFICWIHQRLRENCNQSLRSLILSLHSIPITNQESQGHQISSHTTNLALTLKNSLVRLIKTKIYFLLTYDPECTESIITLIISDYLFSIMQDDINLGNEIQLRHNQIKTALSRALCRESRSRHFEASLPHIISFKEGWVGTGVFFGKIFNHNSISLEEFQQMTGYDYVLEQTKKLYFDPDHSEHLKKHWSFDEYLQRQLDCYTKPLGL